MDRTITTRAKEHRPQALTRTFISVGRRARLLMARVFHPRTHFGSATIVRTRLTLRQFPGASISFGAGCVLDNDFTAEVRGILQVGNRVTFGHHCTLAASDRIDIGDDCMVAEMVSIRDHDHAFDRIDVPYREQGMVSKPVRIGKNVWLGAKVTVLKGVTIGDNAIVGANAVVTRDISANSVAVGIPARVVRRLM